MTNNITIADKNRIDFIINFLSKFGVTDINIHNESYGYDISFVDETNFLAINALLKYFPTSEDDIENICNNCIIIYKPDIFNNMNTKTRIIK